MLEPRKIGLEEVAGLSPDSTVVWSVPSVRGRVAARFPHPLGRPLESIGNASTLVVVGGGTLIDEAKAWRLEQSARPQLVAIPSLWGSGAEASPIAVLNRGGRKVVRVEAGLLPDARAVWPELAETLPARTAKFGCGDVWAHALEAFLSPLGTPELRSRIAGLMRAMLEVGLVKSAAWFEFSALACACQARAGVGLVHGIAHTLEPILAAGGPAGAWSHAELCSICLEPVMRFNARASSKWSDLMRQHDLDGDRIMATLTELHDAARFAEIAPLLESHWPAILRDPCTRTNSSLVRAATLESILPGIRR